MACDIVALSQRGGNQLGSAGGLAEYHPVRQRVSAAAGRRPDAGGMAE